MLSQNCPIVRVSLEVSQCLKSHLEKQGTCKELAKDKHSDIKGVIFSGIWLIKVILRGWAFFFKLHKKCSLQVCLVGFFVFLKWDFCLKKAFLSFSGLWTRTVSKRTKNLIYSNLAKKIRYFTKLCIWNKTSTKGRKCRSVFGLMKFCEYQVSFLCSVLVGVQQWVLSLQNFLVGLIRV